MKTSAIAHDLASPLPLSARTLPAIDRRLPMPERPPIPTSLTLMRRAVSYRRHLLDAYMDWCAPLMRGAVIDLGGKRERKRGTFRPPAAEGTTWKYVNLDPETSPDFLCDVSHVPLPDGSADCVVCTEVLEHLADPAACVNEAHRLLRPRGVFIASAPFLYPVHNDPRDFQRFTADGLRQLHTSFSDVRVFGMGGYLGSLGMFVEFGGRQLSARHAGARLVRKALFETGRLLQWRDAHRAIAQQIDSQPSFTTGYFVIAEK